MSIHLARAEELLQQRRHGPAVTELEQHLTIFPDDPIAHALMARAETQRDDRKAALKWAERAVHLAPDLAYCQYVRAWVLNVFDQHKQAEEAVLEALRLEAFDANYYCLLGQIRLNRANWAGALQAAEAGLAIDAAHIDCINVRAMALMRLGRRDTAESAVQGALEQEPDNARTHTNQGWICLRKGRRDEAVEHFREALRLDPTLESARMGLLETLRSKYALYRVLFAFYDWIAGFNSNVRRGIVFGMWIVARLINSLGHSDPALEPIALTFTCLYGVFVFLTWTGRATFDIFVRFHPLGRIALSRAQKAASSWVALCLLSALASVGLLFLSPSGAPLYAAICFALLGIPASQLSGFKGKLWKANLLCAIAYAGIVALELVGMAVKTDPNWLIGSFGVYFLGLVGYTWVRAARAN